MPFLRTVAGPLHHEIPRIKSSRFIGSIARVRSETEVRAFVHQVRQALPGATHHARGWRLDAQAVGSSDDGEVRGTAGRPILDRLVGADLQQTVVVVTRFYGGTKLGTGGLVRAYGQAATEVIDLVEPITERQTAQVVARCDYALQGPLEGVAAAFSAVVIDRRWEQTVQITWAVPVEDRDEMVLTLRERAAGRIEVD